MSSGAQPSRAAPAAYLVALAVLGPFLTPQIGIWEPLGGVSVGSLSWRFGFLGLIYSSLFYLLIALLLATLTAGYFAHRRVLFGLGIASVILSVLLLAGLPFFALDTLQLRKTLTATAFQPYKTAAIKGAALAVLAVPIFLVFSLGALKASRALPGWRGSERQAPSPLIR
ncbi:MAG TPA: hypothetical protein VLB00_13290 [Gemmatimonadales bacterium]|nr:hypothetical protein [Gemmatimonadales bacterium]